MTSGGPAGFAGAVLCGGASRRMGRDKALIEIDGVPMVVRATRALRAAGADPVVALGGEARALAVLGVTAVADADPGAGPLSAIAGALRQSAQPVVLVVACDLLAPDPAVMARIVGVLRRAPAAEVAVPVVDGRHQWVHAAWAATAVRQLDAALASGERSLHRAAEGLRVVEVHGLDASALRDADRPEDLPVDGSPGRPAGEG